VSEILDGAPPHMPRGAPSQAWSVACTLEAWWRLEIAKQKANRTDIENEQKRPSIVTGPRLAVG